MAPEARRTARVEARIAPAQKTIDAVEVVRLSRHAQEQLAALLLNPPTPPTALARAFERHRDLIKE